jgi:hypothetical protein
MVTDLSASPGPLSPDGTTDFGCRPAKVIPANDPAGLCPPPPSYTVLILIMVAILLGILTPCCCCAYCCYRRFRRKPAPTEALAPDDLIAAAPAGDLPAAAGLAADFVEAGVRAEPIEPWRPPMPQEAVLPPGGAPQQPQHEASPAPAPA